METYSAAVAGFETLRFTAYIILYPAGACGRRVALGSEIVTRWDDELEEVGFIVSRTLPFE